MRIEWTGVKEFSRWLADTPGVTLHDLAAAMVVEGERIMAESKRRTPVKTGNLEASGHVKPAKTTRDGVEVALAYGTDYAIYVHEIPATHNVGRDKYLESALKDAAGEFTSNLKARIAASLEARR